MESTTDILRERAKRDDDLVRTLGISLGGHAVVIALVVFFPVGFLDASGADDLDEVKPIAVRARPRATGPGCIWRCSS